ncbi:actin or actin-binding cytoskeletal protein [Lithospermum erythrorhizon]|uniref:Actin-related protein 2/3 complex subunit n=1 Tax=Lithospermum erythrorhizon TaxID=34254 RepID=A0AAV3QS04_LITER
MAAIWVHEFADCITCHSWSPDESMIAFCPNNSEVHIYRLLDDKWDKLYVLQKHDQIVSGIDWSARSNKIVTVSHDRNSYVWNKEGAEWVPTLVILRLNRAALCVQWSPKENKFAVGSGAKTVCICYYEQENNWWVSKLIRKRHESSVTSVAWHPNNVRILLASEKLFCYKILLATTSTDGKCRVFSTFIKGIDTKDSRAGASADTKFGEQIIQLDLSISWSFGVKWSPSGNTLAYVGHNSMIYFVDDVGPSPSAQSVALRDLPLRDVLFISEKVVIGVGFDCNPMVFSVDETGLWHPLTMLAHIPGPIPLAGIESGSFRTFLRFLGERRSASSGVKSGSQFSEAFGKFYGQSKNGSSNDETSKGHGVHNNCINCILPLKRAGDSPLFRFSTSGLDGKVAVWDLQGQEDLREFL